MVSDIEFFNSNTGIVSGQKTIRTTNAGNNWSIVPDVFMGSLSFKPSLKGWGTAMDSVKKTNDGGLTWSSYYVPSGSSLGFYAIFFVNDLTGWLSATYPNGLFKTTTGGEPIGIKQISTEIPINYALHQNYPNPFNPITNIKFDIPKTSFVRLIIYDAIGREAAKLVNEELKPGTYSVDWNASNYPSGVYFYRIQAGEFTETKKMMVIK